MTYVIAKPATRVAGPLYWTGEMALQPTLCQPVVTLIPRLAATWATEAEARQAVDEADPRMWKQGFKAGEAP